MWRGAHTVFFPHLLEHFPSCAHLLLAAAGPHRLRPRKRKGKGKYKGGSRRWGVSIPRICSSGLSSLLASGTESRSSLRLTLGEAVKLLWSYAAAHG